MRQFFLSIIGGGGGAGGGGGNGGARRGTGVSRAREGEWACGCGLSNRPYREQCHACGRPRPAGGAHRLEGGGGKGGGAPAGGGGGGTANGAKGKGARGGARGGNGGGPMGADGRRPLLGRWGGTAASPATGAELKGGPTLGKGAFAVGPATSSGKGPDLASPMRNGDQRGANGGGGKPSADGCGSAACGPRGAWARPPPTVDGEGFQLVQPRRVWQSAQHEGGPGEAGSGRQQQQHQLGVQPQQAGEAATVVDSRPRWSDEDSDDGMYLEDDLEADDRADDGPQDEDGADPQRLRAVYEAHARAVRDLERRSKADGATEDPALRTLRDARDEAERVWRGAKAPVPLSVRMGRAQAKLEKATAAASKARFAIDEFDEWANQRRAELVRKAEEAHQWYLWRDQQMDALHAEAAEKTNGKTNGGGGFGGRGADMSGRIIGDWLPQVQALLEHVQGNPEIEERLSALAAGMHNAGQELQQAQGDSTERFHIGDGAAEAWESQWGPSPEDAGGRHGSGAPAADGNTKGGAAAWRPEGSGRWSRADPAREARRGEGTGIVGSAASAAAATSAESAPGSAGAGNKRGADEPADDDAKGAVRQKTETEAREEADRRKAAELLQQQQAAIAAQQASHEAGEGGFGSQAAQSAAAQQFLQDVCRAVERARHLGIEPKADGKELVELSPMELTQWVAERLGD